MNQSYANVWTRTFLKTEKNVSVFKISGYVWTGPPSMPAWYVNHIQYFDPDSGHMTSKSIQGQRNIKSAGVTKARKPGSEIKYLKGLEIWKIDIIFKLLRASEKRNTFIKEYLYKAIPLTAYSIQIKHKSRYNLPVALLKLWLQGYKPKFY